MIESSLVYIHALKPARRFVGCGSLVEGGYVATCRHVWRIATAAVEESEPGSELEVEVLFPRFFEGKQAVRSRASLASECRNENGPDPDLVLLAVDTKPEDALTLQLATEERFERGDGYAHAGLMGRDPSRPEIVEDVPIEGRIADIVTAAGRPAQSLLAESDELLVRAWFERIACLHQPGAAAGWDHQRFGTRCKPGQEPVA
jgi:hypothetical protein